MPEFRSKLSDSDFNLDHPVWVEDNDFDLARHLHRVGLPAPAGRKEMAEVCGHIASTPLDRSKPCLLYTYPTPRDRPRSPMPLSS